MTTEKVYNYIQRYVAKSGEIREYKKLVRKPCSGTYNKLTQAQVDEIYDTARKYISEQSVFPSIPRFIAYMKERYPTIKDYYLKNVRITIKRDVEYQAMSTLKGTISDLTI